MRRRLVASIFGLVVAREGMPVQEQPEERPISTPFNELAGKILRGELTDKDKGGVLSLFSKDGHHRKEEEGVRLPHGADPTVVRLKDGSCRLYYKVGGGNQEKPRERGDGDRHGLKVEFVHSKYRIAPEGRTGRFVTGQDADILLGGIDFNNSGGPLLFNHPTGLASDGKCLLVADRWNNRVLVWKEAPAGNTPPDLVLGQKNFVTNNPGAGKDEMNWPGNVAITPEGTRIAVADTNNNRILMWNGFPKENGAAANVVLNLSRYLLPDGKPPGWPWGVWTDGTKLGVVATHGKSVLIWNAIPSRGDEAPDLILTPRNAWTPRNITSDGNFFMLSDHNYGPREDNRAATMVWKSFPTASDQEPDFVIRPWLKGCITKEKKLIVGGLASLYLWDTLPQSASDGPSLTLKPSTYANGDGPDVVVAKGRLYVCNYNGNNVLGWNGIPTRATQEPNFAVGSPTVRSQPWLENYFITNPVPATDGKSLFVSSDFEGMMYVWRNLPDESGAKPDIVYRDLPIRPWDNALSGETLVLAGKDAVVGWKKLPLNGEKPDLIFRRRIGGVDLQALAGVALDATYFYLAEGKANKIYVWEGIPKSDSEPKFILDVKRPGRLSSDGKYLAVAPGEGQAVLIYEVSELGSGKPPARVGGPGKFNLPGKAVVAHGALFVADTCFNRVHVWHKIEDALAGRPADALLGARDARDDKAEIGRNRLSWPGAVAFDGCTLWVGEFKFSTRILRFRPN